MNLLKQDEKLGRLTSNLYICRTETMTALVDCGTRRLYKVINFYSVLIVWSAS